METRMVALKNMINAQVGVKDPVTGANRRWNKRGQILPLPFDVVEQLLWNDGFKHMIDCGILYIENMQDKKDLGLEPMDAEAPVNIIALSEAQIKDYLTVMPLNEFRVAIAKLPKVQVDNLIEYAIDNKIATDSAKCMFLKETTGKDILRAISNRAEMEEEEKREKERQAYAREEGRRG